MKKKEPQKKKIKTTLHHNNKNRKQYDLLELVKEIPELEKYVKRNIEEERTIDFSMHCQIIIVTVTMMQIQHSILMEMTQ